MRVILPLVFLALSLAWITTREGTTPRADLVFVNQNEVFTLDPQRMSWMQDLRIAQAMYEGLLRWDPADYSVRPGVASLPGVSDDGLTYTFKLDQDARWSNGVPVTAHDFAYAWMRAMLPDTAADYAGLFFVIDGAEDFLAWRADRLASFNGDAAGLWQETEDQFRDTVGIDVIDERTLEVRLAMPTAYFKDLLCFGTFFPLHRPAVEGWSHDAAAAWPTGPHPPFADRGRVSLDPATARFQQDPSWSRPGNHVANGPYMLDGWRYKRDFRLARNPHFHRAHEVKTERITIRTIEDPNTAVLAFSSGEVDWLAGVGVDYKSDLIEQRLAYDQRHADEFATLRASGMSEAEALAALPEPGPGERRDLHIIPSFGTDFYSFNCRPELADGRVNPFADARVRRAFVHATDRTQITEHVTRMRERPSDTLIPHGSIAGYESPTGLGFDPDAARREMQAAGWIDRDGDGRVEDESGAPFPPVEILFTTNTSRYKWISINLKSQWESTLGVSVVLVAKESGFYKEDLRSGAFMIARGRWYGDYGDPTTFLDFCRTGDGNNDRGYSNPAVDDLLARAMEERDPDARFALLSECERIVVAEDVPMLTICQLVELYMYDPAHLRGISHHPRLSQFMGEMYTP